ncbi:MAG: hypothetical protein K0R73_88 [Candidatus Midichloriaceae bacterium]|jgi:hypothetical protein|nr:hypothetical protein [Candidatus Midichloriaceae bacterium]
MIAYTVYLKHTDQGTENIVYVPEKFSWLAFLFTIPWLIYHRLWNAAFILIFSLIFLNQVELMVSWGTPTIICTLASLAAGFYGNDMIRSNLEKNGYVFNDVIMASSEQEAELRFILGRDKDLNE